MARLPDPAWAQRAARLAGLFSIATAYLNWAICRVASALFLGTVRHGGLSGSAPPILAPPGNPMLARACIMALHRRSR